MAKHKHHRDNAPGGSQRQLRVGELIRHALADIFLRGESGDPDLERLNPTVVEVQISPDLKIATAFVRTGAGAASAVHRGPRGERPACYPIAPGRRGGQARLDRARPRA